MPHYFFHIRNGQLSTQDDEGGEFDNFAAAEREAVMSVRDLVVESVKCGDPVTGWKIEITDEDGKILGSVLASAVLH
jgi:hypothetical protein